VNPTLSALLICIVAAGLEGALAGSGVRQRLAALRMPPYSPSFTVWLLIGLVYYAICFVVLRHLLAATPFTFTGRAALALLVVVLVANALWSVLFFRRRDLRASFIAFISYAAVVAALVLSLSRIYPFGAALFVCYCMYLLYATWWAYRLLLLNTQETNKPMQRTADRPLPRL
jgi:tryptophan-rich sensory protein